MEYADIKKRINEIGANLTSITIIKVEDYTHQPSDFDIASGIKEVINDLDELYQTIIRG